jgi:Tol biopolymer transport system component
LQGFPVAVASPSPEVGAGASISPEVHGPVEAQRAPTVATPVAASTPTPSARRRPRWLLPALALVGATAIVTMVAIGRRHAEEPPAPRLVTLASGAMVFSAAVSPDGTRLAFAADDDQGRSQDIWLKEINGTERRRLTSGPAEEWGLAWAPNGQQIAFIREADGRVSINLVSVLGGHERRLLDFPASSPLSWSPDGRWLAVSRAAASGKETSEVAGIYLLPPGGGEPRLLTRPPAQAFDQRPAFAPGGGALAYATCRSAMGGVTECDVKVLALDAEARPRGDARVVARQVMQIMGITWTLGGRVVAYSTGAGPGARLWSVAADGSRAPEEVAIAAGAQEPFAGGGEHRLGFLRDFTDADIYRWQPGSPATPHFSSAAWDLLPDYSPDGRRVAFTSGRETRWNETYLAHADGSGIVRLTLGPGRMLGNGGATWSPDGRRLVFDSEGERTALTGSDIWVIDADGGGLRRLTRSPAFDSVPSWSRDGKWIYFSSTRTGRSEIWRVPVEGGAEEQVTRDGGYFARDSFDGRTLYFKRGARGDPLVARDTASGAERTIVNCVPAFGYDVGPEGVYHFDCEYARDAPTYRALRHWDARTGEDREVALLQTGRWAALGLAVSPDGQSVLFVRVNPSFSVMMIENFR